LRDREGDIGLLIRHFLNLHGRRKGKRVLEVDPAAMVVLEKYRWPGNVREVENLIERLVVLCENGTIQTDDLPDYVINNSEPQHQSSTRVTLPEQGVDLDGVLERIENGFIEQALQRSRGNKTIAAELLKLNRTTFIERLRKKGMLQTSRRNSSMTGSVRKLTDNSSSLTEQLREGWDSEALGRVDAGQIVP
jgi:DNA-binding NtrC family response regulator